MRPTMLLAAALLAVAPFARSAESKTEPQAQEMTQKHRKMAELHTKAAGCIASGRPMKECHAEVMKDCPMMESGMCPFMEGKGMKKGNKKGMRGMHEGAHGGMKEEGEAPARP